MGITVIVRVAGREVLHRLVAETEGTVVLDLEPRDVAAAIDKATPKAQFRTGDGT